MDTTQLIQRVQGGDRRALVELYHGSYRPAFYVAERITGDGHTAYELVQEAYRKAFSSLELLPDKSAFNAWLNGIVGGKCREYWEQKHSVRLFSFSGEQGDRAETSLEDEPAAFRPDENTDYAEPRRRFTALLDDLPIEQRLILLMAEAQGLSVKEIAGALGVSEDVVTSCLNRGKMQLRVRAEESALNGAPIGVPDEELIPFLGWMLRQAVSETPVHRMQPFVEDAPFGEVSRLMPVQKKNTLRNALIIAASALLVIAGAFVFTVFALPKITGEPNVISELIVPKQPVNTPEQVVKALETAVNENDRDGMAKCFLPNQSLARNVQGGGIQILNGIIGFFQSGEKVEVRFELQNLTTDKENADTASGEVKVTYNVPLLGKQTQTEPITFQLMDHQWYIKDFMNLQ